MNNSFTEQNQKQHNGDYGHQNFYIHLNKSCRVRICKPFRVSRNQPGGIDSLKSIPKLLKRLQIWAQVFTDLFHVGLARTEPNIAIDNILQRHTLRSLSYLEFERYKLDQDVRKHIPCKVSSGQKGRRKIQEFL
jgi:hypothetical protein